MLLTSHYLLDITLSAEIEKTILDVGTGSSKNCSNQSKTQKQYKGDSKYHYMQEDHHMNHGSYQKQQMMVILWDHRKSQWLSMLWEKKGCRRFMRTWTLRRRYCNNRPHFIQVFTMKQLHRLLLHFILLHISNGSVSTSLVGHVLYSADLTSAICSPHYYLMVHRYIYSRYSSVFPTLYQLYHSLLSSTLNSSSSLYLSVATWVTP